MNRYLPRTVSDEEKTAIQREGVVCLRQVFEDEWIELLRLVGTPFIALNVHQARTCKGARSGKGQDDL
jgi:hypothetical protein